MTKKKTPKHFFAVLFSAMSLSVSGAFAQELYLDNTSPADIRLRQNVQIGADEYRTVAIEPDRTSVIRNPLTGWVMYLGRGWSKDFGTEVGYDNWPAGPDGQMKVRVSDYCGTAYIRTS